MRLLLLAAALAAVSASAQPGTLDPAFGAGGRTLVSVGDNDVAYGLAFEANGRVVLAGTTGDISTEDTSVAVARFLTDGRPVAADAPAVAARAGLTAAPNPFGVRTAVTLTLAEAGEARVSVFDALGRRVAVLHDGPLAAGARTFQLGGEGLAPGVYVVRAEGGGGAAVRIVRR